MRAGDFRGAAVPSATDTSHSLPAYESAASSKPPLSRVQAKGRSLEGHAPPPRLASSTASAPASYFEAPAGHLRMRLPWAPWRPCLILPAMVFQHCNSIEKGGSRNAILFSV
jgi:hypothetical protein